MTRHLLPVVAMSFTATALAATADAQQGPAATTHAIVQNATAHTSTRLLVARSEKLDKIGWLEAETTYRPDTGMSYRIVREGGDKGIRNRVLRKVLENEKAMSAPDASHRFALSPDNYRLLPEGDGRAVRLTPRRREPALVDGLATIAPDGRLRKVEGRLAKSPSFWVRSVDIARTYQDVAGHSLPVHVESVADVRFAGTCEFSMWIDYTAVDGRVIATATARREPPATAAVSLLVAWQSSMSQ